MKKKPITVYLEEEMMEEVKTYCAYSKTSVSEVVNIAIRQWYNMNNQLIADAIKQSKELDELINSYKNKLK
jgi:hypothetical protein